MARRGGGLAVVHRDSFISRVINSESFSSFESQLLKVGSLNAFYSVLIYRPPGPAGVFLTDFTDFLSSIIKLEKVLIIGDFNLHIDDSTSNTAVDILSITDSFNFIQHVTGPTHIKGHTLDLVFSLGLDIVNARVEDVHVSDHSCVFFNINFPRDPPPLRIRAQRRIINYDTAERFSALFDPCSLMGCTDVDVLIQSFNDQCLSILDKVAPVKSSTVYHKKHCPWIDEAIQSFRRNCRKVERLWKSSKLEVHRLHLKELRVTLNEMLRKARTCFFSQLISLNKHNPRILFDTINKIVSPSSPQATVSSKSACNDFLHFFVNKIRDVRINISPSLSQISACDLSPAHCWSTFTPVTLHDITSLLHSLKPSSCPMDVVPTVLFVQAFDSIGPCIVEMLNTSLLTGVVPSFF